MDKNGLTRILSSSADDSATFR